MIKTPDFRWFGKQKCDFCGYPFIEKGKTFYDAPTYSGSWAVMCEECARLESPLTEGQQYDSDTFSKLRNLYVSKT